MYVCVLKIKYVHMYVRYERKYGEIHNIYHLDFVNIKHKHTYGTIHTLWLHNIHNTHTSVNSGGDDG